MTRDRWLTAALSACLLTIGAIASTTDAPDSWDGLVQIKPKRMDMVYVLPGADFRPYSKVLLDGTEVAFRKDWLKSMNDTRTVSRKMDDERSGEDQGGRIVELQRRLDQGAGESRLPGGDDTRGPNVLRLSPAIADLYINAPDTMEAGRVRTYTAEAGEATLILEVRDSQTNGLVGRVVDRRETRSSVAMQQANARHQPGRFPRAVLAVGLDGRQGSRGTKGDVAGAGNPDPGAEAQVGVRPDTTRRQVPA